MPSGRGLIDTSVVIEFDAIDTSRLPAEVAISAVTLAELASGPLSTPDGLERARRQDHLQRVEASFESLPFNSLCARAYGHVYAATVDVGRKARGARSLDLLIAATAVAHELALYTLNARDLRGLENLLEIVDLGQ